MLNKYYIKTYGCQMNENDSEIMAGLLESKGLIPAKDETSADIILINTCSVRDSAERKAKGFAHIAGQIKKNRPDVIIGITGCMAERVGEELLKKFKFIDFVLGPKREHEIKNIVAGRQERSSQGAKRKNSVNAWITIMEGCDNFCSFCIVPYVRGREKSRPVGEVVKEIEMLDKNIFKEITLLGQNVNSYEYGFADLLKKVSKIDGVIRVRFMTSHPRDMSDEIIGAVAENQKVCEMFHLPLQSGDDEVLRAMNRGYDSKYYRELVMKIRKRIPGAAITSDVIAGFPGETDRQFQNTLALISELQFDTCNTLAFDARPGTKAAVMNGQLDKKTIKGRLQRLMNVVKETSLKKNKGLIGTNQELLVTSKGMGRTRTNKIVRFNDKADRTGELINVEIKSALSWVLQGEVIC